MTGFYQGWGFIKLSMTKQDSGKAVGVVLQGVLTTALPSTMGRCVRIQGRQGPEKRWEHQRYPSACSVERTNGAGSGSGERDITTKVRAKSSGTSTGQCKSLTLRKNKKMW